MQHIRGNGIVLSTPFCGSDACPGALGHPEGKDMDGAPAAGHHEVLGIRGEAHGVDLRIVGPATDLGAVGDGIKKKWDRRCLHLIKQENGGT